MPKQTSIRNRYPSLRGQVSSVMAARDRLPQNNILPPYDQSNSRGSQIDHCPLYSPPAPVAEDNMNIFTEIGPSEVRMAPAPGGFSSNHSFYNSQVGDPKQHLGPPPEDVTWSWPHNLYSIEQSAGDCGSYGTGVDGVGPGQKNILPGDGSFGECSPNSDGSYNSSHTSYSQLSTTDLNIDPGLTQNGSPSEGFHNLSITDTPHVSSPGYFATETSVPSSFGHQGTLSAQASKYDFGQASSYFADNPNCSQYSMRQEQQQLNSVLVGKDICPNPSIGDFTLHSPGQLTHRNESQDTTADRPSLGPYACEFCGVKCGRETDLRRHKEQAKKHNAPSGPACVEPGCTYPMRFTRVDNFGAHLRTKHGKTKAEANAIIAEWRERGGAKPSGREGSRAAIRRRESAAAKNRPCLEKILGDGVRGRREGGVERRGTM